MDSPVLDVSVRLLAVLALVLANGFFVAAEFAIISVRKTRIDQLLAEGSRMARPVRRALENPDQFIAATQLGITMASLGLGWIGEPALASMLEPLFEGLPEPISVATSHTIAIAIAFSIITALHIVLGELAPKTVALQHPEKVALIVAKPTELFLRVFHPFIRALNGMGWAVVRLFGMKAASGHGLVHSEEELKMLVTASQQAGVLEEDEEQMLHRVFHFAEFTAAEMMVPRTEMTAVKSDASLSWPARRTPGCSACGGPWSRRDAATTTSCAAARSPRSAGRWFTRCAAVTRRGRWSCTRRSRWPLGPATAPPPCEPTASWASSRCRPAGGKPPTPG
jgi:CBS domain containing-hemolysin-like protein